MDAYINRYFNHKLIFVLVTTVLLCFAISAIADVGPDWLQQGSADVEDQVSKISKKLFYALIGLSMGVGAIAVAWGFVEHHGIIGKRENGVEKIKNGLIGIVLALLGGGIVGFAAGILN